MRYLSHYFFSYSLCLFLISYGATKNNTQNGATKSVNKFFEGQITYQLKYEPKSANLTKEQAETLFGNKQIYIVKDDKYINRMNGNLKMTQYYIGNDTLFVTTTQSKELLWIDATKLNDKVLSKDLTRNVEVINGIECDLLTIISEKGSYKYYFNSSFKINEKYFDNHRVGFWDISTRETKSIMLKSILSTEDEHIELIATNIQSRKVDEKEFELPNYERKRFPIKYEN